MDPIAIQIPQIRGEQEITVEVKIDGVAQHYTYRVEVFYWRDCKVQTENRVDCLREIINSYDKNWEIYHIDQPTKEYVSVTFRKRRPSAITNVN